MKETILVTGGAGYVGAHVVEALRDTGLYTIEVVDYFREGKRNIIHDPSIHYHEVDIRDKQHLMDVFISTKPSIVFHFAGLITVPESVADPISYYDNNIIGGLVLLECMKKTGVTKIIFSSSAAVYGEPVSERINEQDPKLPVNPYGRSKLMFEEILKDYAKAYGISSVSLRYFCPAGSNVLAGLGEWRTHETHVIPLIVLTLLGKRDEFFVFGNDFPTLDGTGIRDYIHISDLVNAHLAAMQKIKQEDAFVEVYNVGINKGFSVLELIKAAEDISGKKLNYSFKPRRPGDPSCLIADSSKIQRELGWVPKVTNIQDIIRSSYAFFKDIN